MIAVLGWGSLVWNPGSLDVDGEWRPDGPELPVEFARVSGGDRLTLVLVEGIPLQRTLWTLSRKATLAGAAEDLRRREGATDAGIGRWSALEEPPTELRGVSETIAAWAAERGIDGVVWTALGPKKSDGTKALGSTDELLAYLRGLVVDGKERAAKEYVEKAPAQIDTPLRRRIRKELGWE